MKIKIFDQLNHNERRILKISFFLLLYMICTIGYTFFSFKSNSIQGYDDLNFHLSRVVGLNSIWNSPISFSSFNGLGNPVNLFYGWITLYPMIFLIKIFGQIVLGYNIYFALLTFLTFLICHFSFNEVIKNNFSSCVFSLCYTFSAYRATDIYSRAAVGESIALSLIPLVFCSFYLLLEKKRHPWKLLAISMSLLIYSHVLSTLITVAYLFLFLLIFFIYKQYFKKKKEKEFQNFKVFLNLLKAIMLTMLLTSFFYLPMMEQLVFQPLNMPLTYSLDSMALSFDTELIGGALNNDLYSCSIGLVLLVLLTILFFRFKKLDWLAKSSLLFACFSLFLSTNLFPWSTLQNTFLNIIQFPWRINAYSSLFIAFSFSAFISKDDKVNRVL